MADDMAVTFDEYGFVTDPGQWNRTVAASIADTLGLEKLGDEHWRVLEHLRTHYLQHGALPPMEEVCHALKLDRHCVRRLFRGPEQAWKVAGLPDPGIEARTYMRNEEP